jgi:hypothetical protein
MRYNVIFGYMHTLYNNQVRVISISITSNISHFFIRTFRILSSGYFETYSPLLLTMVALLYSRTLELTLITTPHSYSFFPSYLLLTTILPNTSLRSTFYYYYCCCDIYKSSYNISELNSPPPPFSFIPLPYSWNSFNRSPI